MIQDDFLHLIDEALPRIGYGDRASFIRDAVRRQLVADGVPVPLSLSSAPSRAGKGGRQKKKASPSHLSLVAEDSPSKYKTTKRKKPKP